MLGLPRGGVPVAYEIAKKLNLPLDVCFVKKLGFPNSPETAMGAVGFWYKDFSQVSDREVCDLLCQETSSASLE